MPGCGDGCQRRPHAEPAPIAHVGCDGSIGDRCRGRGRCRCLPSRTVTLIVPYAAGGASDTVARIIAESMTRTLGQQMIVENVGGASGTIGAARVARADPDGYTVMLHTPSHATNTLLFRKLPYGPTTAFQPIGVVTETPMTVVGKADLPPNSAAELFDYIRTNKDQDHDRQCRAGRSLTPMRHADHEHARRPDDTGFLQGRGPGDDRPARRAD